MKVFGIHFSEDVLRQMCLSAIESYVLGDGKNKTQIETLSFLWGYYNVRSEDWVEIRIETASECVSAKRTTHSVSGYHESSYLKSAFMDFWSPELSFLGDFHTHPYENIREVRATRGYEFSETDFASFLKDDELWGRTNNPLMIVMTICKLERVRDHDLELIGGGYNIAMFSATQFRFWVNACVGYINTENKRCVTPNYSQDVILCNPMHRFMNVSGIKIDGI